MEWINQVHYGDCRHSMNCMIADGVKVQMCVTSPPYWGLRDYGCPGQFGLEPTPAEYVANMVEVFSLVRDLLADDGTLWLNLGDSYSGSGVNDGTKSPGLSNAAARGNPVSRPGAKTWNYPLKPKDLVGIPWMVAFALRSAGWWLRSDIIWHKPNPMPESVNDRPTKAHEYLFLLAKAQKYFYDGDALKTDCIAGGKIRNGPIYSAPAQTFNRNKKTGNMADDAVWLTPTKANKRSVWSINSVAYSGSHFATFPPKLIEPCILAGSRLGDIVFDPFMGSGTTAMVAERLGRKWIGCELNEKYKPLIDERTAQLGLGI